MSCGITTREGWGEVCVNEGIRWSLVMVAAAAIRLIGDLGVGDLAAGEGASDSSGGSPD